MADGDRSLSSGMSLPQWMKTRMNDRDLSLADLVRLNFDQAAFSPPENDDSFLYIRYNRTPASRVDNNTNISTTNGQSTPVIEVVPKAPSTVKISNNTATDFSKHTAPCKQFIPNSINVISEATRPILGKLKSNGTDDGFKGEAAQCGSSVIRVAHQMVSGKFLSRGSSIQEEEFATEPQGFNRALRRGSKSLPSSPLTSPNTSPKARRRHQNRYFSGSTDSDKIHGSWILSGLLRKQDKLSCSVNVINEEESINESLTKTVSQVSIDDEMSEVKVPKQKRAKPSELREMNFWSPTSM